MATEKVKLFEIDIDVSKALKDTEDLKKKNELLKESLDELKKANKQASAEFILLNAEYKANQQQISKNEKQLQALISTQENELGTLEQLAAKNAILRREREQLDLTTKEGNDRLEEINKTIDINNQLIKESSDLQKQAKLNVGNYTESINKALEAQNLFSGSLTQVVGNFVSLSEQEGGVKGAFSGFISGIKGATQAALRFIATPLGAVITGIVAALGALKLAINSSQSATDKLSNIWAGLGGVLDVGLSKISNYVKTFKTLFQGDLAKFADEQIKAVKDLTNGYSDAFNALSNLNQAAKDIERTRTQNIKTLAILEQDEARFQSISDDGTKSIKERINATNLLFNVQKEKLQLNTDIAKRELALADAQLSQQIKNGNTNNDEFIKSKNEKLAAVLKFETEEVKLNLEKNKKIKEFEYEQIDATLNYYIDNFDSIKTANEKLIADETKSFEQRQNLLNKTVDLNKQAFSNQVKAIEDYLGKSINANELLAESDSFVVAERVKALGVTTQVSDKILEVLREQRAAQSDLYEAQRDLSKSALDANIKDLTITIQREKLANDEKLDNLRAIKFKEDTLNELQYSKGLKTLNEYLLQKEQLQKDFDTKVSDSTKAAQALDLQNEYDTKLTSNQRLFELKVQQLKEQEKLEIEAAEKIGADSALIAKKYAQIQTEIALTRFNNELKLASDFAGSIQGLFAENTIANKVAAVAQATINTYLGATAAFSQTPGGIIIKSLAATAAIISGITNVKKILAVPVPGGGGGASGSTPSISGGGVPVPRSQSNINPQIGQGIVSRNSANIGANGQNLTLQPTLIIDNVTANQNRQAAQNNTAIL